MNVFGVLSSGRTRGGGLPYLRVKFPEPQEWDNLDSWRDQHDWDKQGTTAEVTAKVDPDALQTEVTVKGDVKPLPAYANIDVDFYGHAVSGDRVPGPFADLLTKSGSRGIDQRFDLMTIESGPSRPLQR